MQVRVIIQHKQVDVNSLQSAFKKNTHTSVQGNTSSLNINSCSRDHAKDFPLINLCGARRPYKAVYSAPEQRLHRDQSGLRGLKRITRELFSGSSSDVEDRIHYVLNDEALTNPSYLAARRAAVAKVID